MIEKILNGIELGVVLTIAAPILLIGYACSDKPPEEGECMH